MKRVLSAIFSLVMVLSLTAPPLFSVNAKEDVTLTLDAKSSESNFVAPDGAVTGGWDASNVKYSSTMWIETVASGAYVYFTGLEIPESATYTVLLDVRSQNDATFEIRIGTDFDSAKIVGDLEVLSANSPNKDGNCYEYTVGTVALAAGSYSIYFYNNTSGTCTLGAGKTTLQDITPRFSAGTQNPVTSTVKQEIEDGYTYYSADGTATEKGYSSSGTGGWSGTVSVFYNCPKGSYFEYAVTVPKDGTYTPGVLTRYHANGFGTWTVTIDGIDVGTYESKYPGLGDYYAYVTLNDVDLTAGEHAVRFTAQGAGAYGVADEDVFGCDYFDLTLKTSIYSLSTESLSAYTSTRVVTEGRFDIRFVLLSADGNVESGDTVTITFRDADGESVFEVVRTIGENMNLYTEANAAGLTYAADEGCQLFGCVVVDIPDNAFSTVTVCIRRDGTDLAVGTQSYESLRA